MSEGKWGERRLYWKSLRPVPESQGILEVLKLGLWSHRRQRLAHWTKAMQSRLRTKPHTWLYVRLHFLEMRDEARLMAASHSVPIRPSTEKTRGVKFFRCLSQSSRYFSFFSLSCRARTVFEEEARCELFSKSVTRTSKMAVVPRDQNPCAAMSPRSSGAGSMCPCSFRLGMC